MIEILDKADQQRIRAQLKAGNALMAEAIKHRRPAAHSIELIKSESRYAAAELIRREQFIGEVYDPFHADDGIGEAFLKNGNPIFWTSHDFLNWDRGCTHVVTEPTRELGAAYARKALSLVTEKVALLLPVAWMTTPEAKKLFDETPIARIYILTRRLRFRKEGNRLAPMGWYLWEKGHFQGVSIKWV